MEGNKRILFILPRFTFGGTVFSTLNMISILSKYDIDISVLAMTHQGPVKKYYESYTVLPENVFLSALTGDYKKENNICRKLFFLTILTIKRISEKIGINLADYIYKLIANRIQSQEKYSIVASCQEGDSTYFASFFDSAKQIAWCRTEYTYYKNQISTKTLEYEQVCYRKFDKIVCVSQTTRDDFVKYFSGLDNLTLAIHNIQNVENITSMAKETLVDKVFDTNTFTIVSVGRIAPQKRFPMIPEIASKIKSRNIKFKWYIIGDGNVDGENDKLKNNIRKFDVADVVICIGSRINPYPYIYNSNLLVNTSSYEACPRVVIEAKILKTPVICSDFSSAREFVTNDYDGYVDRLEKLDDRIYRMISDKDYYSIIKDNCDKYVFDTQHIIEQLKELFIS